MPIARGDPELARLLYDEYQLRQTHYWRSLARFAGAIITLNIAPYVQITEFSLLKGAGAFVMGIACMLSLTASWLLNAEYLRLLKVRESYYAQLPPGVFSSGDGDKSKGLFTRFQWLPIGTVTTLAFLFGFFFISCMNSLAVLGLFGEINSP